MFLNFQNRLLNKRVLGSFIPSRQELNTQPNLKNLLIEEIEDKVVLTLNRPNVLNALTRSLCRGIYSTLKKVEKEKSLVILKGAGGKAFSSGGDLRKLYSAGKRYDNTYVSDLIIHLNASIYLIRNYEKPVVALLNEVVSGGGVGLSMFARYRISTEQTRFLMPETKLGFHPNAAATYFFNRTIGKLGYYLALTSDTLKGADLVHAGYSSYFCKHSNLENLERELLTCLSHDDVDIVIERHCEKELPAFTLEPVMDQINECFAEPTIEDIFEKLRKDGSVWAQETIDKMNRCSPTSLKVALKQLREGKYMDLAECLVMESHLTINFAYDANLLEGIRIMLNDRSGCPNWHPQSLSQVTEDLVQSYFQPNAGNNIREMLNEVKNSRLTTIKEANNSYVESFQCMSN